MAYFAQKWNGLKSRWADLAYGIVYLRAGDFHLPGKLWIGGRFRQVRFGEVGSQDFLYEFRQTCINDCYRLSQLKRLLGTVDTIVDIGANKGLFLVAARKTFPRAAITCYEPNRQLETFLDFNARSLNGQCYFEAVTREDCRLELQFAESHLHTTTVEAVKGDTPGTAFRTVVARAGGHIDVLKLDCEGGEWALLDDPDPWQAIRSLTMEYHLWARPDTSVMDLRERITGLGFHIIAHDPLTEQFGLITAIKNQQ